MDNLRPYKQKSRLHVRIPKRELSPLRRACLSLGLDVNAQPETNLAWWMGKTELGKTGIEYLRWSDDEQARQIVKRFDSLNATEQKAVKIDYLIMATGADVYHVWGVIQEEMSRIDGFTAAVAACHNKVKVLQKTLERAMEPDGHADRVLFFQLAGELAGPQNSRVWPLRFRRR